MGTGEKRGQVASVQKRAFYSMPESLEDSEELLKREGGGLMRYAGGPDGSSCVLRMKLSGYELGHRDG